MKKILEKYGKDFEITRKGDIFTIVPLKKDGNIVDLFTLAFLLCLSKDIKC